MKIEIIKETLKNKSLKKEFAIITNLVDGNSEIFFPGNNLTGVFSKYLDEIEKIFHLNKNGIIENSEIFVQTFKNPIKVIVVGAVDIAMHLPILRLPFDYKCSIIKALLSSLTVSIVIVTNLMSVLAIMDHQQIDLSRQPLEFSTTVILFN